MKNIFLLTAICCISIFGHAQQSELTPVLQTGHGDDILFADVDPAMQLMATADKHNILLWNTANGKQLRTMRTGLSIRGVALCNKAQYVAVLIYDHGITSALYFYHAQTGALTDSISFVKNSSWGKSTPPMDELISSGNRSTIAVRSFSQMYIVDATTRQPGAAIELQSYDNTIAYNPAQQAWQFAAQHNSKIELYTIDASNTKQLSATFDIDDKPRALQFHASGKMVMLLASNKLMFVDPATNAISYAALPNGKTITSYSHYTVKWNASGTAVLCNIAEDAHIFNLATQAWEKDEHNDVKFAKLLVPSDEQGRQIAAVNGSRISILQSQKLFTNFNAKLFSLDRLEYSPNGKMISSTPPPNVWSNSSYVINLATGRLSPENYYPHSIYQWLSDSLVLTSLPTDYDKKGQLAQIINFYTGKNIRRFEYPKTEHKSAAALLSPDGKVFAGINGLYKELVIMEGDNFERQTLHKIPGYASDHIAFTPDSKWLVVGSESIRILNVAQKKWTVLKDTARTYSIDRFSISPNGKEIWYTFLDADVKTVVYSYELATGKYQLRRTADTLIATIQHHPTKPYYAIGFFNGVVELRNTETDALVFSKKLHGDIVKSILFHPLKDIMTTAGDDKMLCSVDLNTGQLKYSLALLANHVETGPAIFTPDNYYMLPPSLMTEMHFVKDFQTYSFAQFDLQLNRPDKVLQSMGEADEEMIGMQAKAAQRRLQKAGIVQQQSLQDFDRMEPLLLHNKKELTASNLQQLPVLELATTFAAAEIKQLNIYINGQKSYQARGGVNQWKIPIALTEGSNLVEAAYLTSDGTESLREAVEFRYTPATPVAGTTYYIGIGVSQYADSNYNLQYAKKDVQDIAAAITKKYANASVHVFTDSVVSQQTLQQVKKILQQTHVQDRVIVSYSGHGLLDTGYNFYLASFQTNFQDPAKQGLAYSAFTGIFDSVAARQKLLLIDACHSGEIDRDNFSFSTGNMAAKPMGRSSIRKVQVKTRSGNTVKLMETYFADVSKDAGVNIISAAAGEEYALESSQWNNGVFTSCFLQAVFELKADTNYDKKVSQSELRKYMQQKVQELTNGKQQPTSRSVNTSYDWEL
ncbi:MAG TPA: caspase family protein [Phnomibacter sp.]|nr:caspase family protein [Phnomibacter sp.]